MREPVYPGWTEEQHLRFFCVCYNLKQVRSCIRGVIGIEQQVMAKLYFNTRDELNRIEVSKIVYFEADGNYTDIVMVNKLRAAICMNLGEMETALAEQLGSCDKTFMRIGKRFIINMQYIYQINVLKQQLILSDYDHFAFQISISKDALRKVKELMLQTRR